MSTGIGAGRLLIRIDDVCQTSSWSVLLQLESIMVERGICPIVAIVPKNMDDELVVEPPSPSYWDDLVRWQALGYSMALHGYHHTCTQQGGGIINTSSCGEFNGLPESEQFDLLRRGVEELESHGIHPTAWVAPRHSFDWATVAALSRVGIHYVSDGLFVAPRNGPYGSLWIPQQIGRIRAPLFGVMTACLHVNRWGAAEIRQFGKQLGACRECLASLDEIASVRGAWPTWNAGQIERGDIVRVARRLKSVVTGRGFNQGRDARGRSP
jgi:hypothetical protein